MSHAHKVHCVSLYKGPKLAERYDVWCEAGDLDLTNLTAELAANWVAKHTGEHPDPPHLAAVES
jgi:hypothetical protein